MTLYEIIKKSEMSESDKERLDKLEARQIEIEDIAVKRYLQNLPTEAVLETLFSTEKMEYYNIKHKIRFLYGENRNTT